MDPRSFKMKWFKGDVLSAASESRNRNLLVLVYVSGDDGASRSMDSTFDNADVSAACEKHCVCLKLSHDSELARQFVEIYQLKGVPSTFLIGASGVPLDVIEGHVSTRTFLNMLKEAVVKNGAVFTERTTQIVNPTPVPKNISHLTEGSEKMDAQPAENNLTEMSTPAEREPKPQSTPAQTKSRLQFRMPDGSNTSDVFAASDSLGSVWKQMAERLGLRMNDYSLVTSHPRQNFTTDHMPQSLEQLGLVPSAVILAIPRIGQGRNSAEGPLGKLISFLLGVLLAIWNFITGLFSGGGDQAAAAPVPGTSSSYDSAPSRDERASAKRARHMQSTQIRKRREGNITRLSAVRDDDSDDEATWNGNSTQQM